MSDEPGGGVNIGNPAGFVAAMIREGTRATQGLFEFRDAGGHMRTQDWYRLYGQVSDTIARQPLFGAIEPSSIPNAADYGEYEMGRGGQYATQVNIVFRDRDSGMIGTAQYTHITDDPHTPDEAITAGVDLYSQADIAAQYNQVILGGHVSGIWQTVPYGR